ncbi:MAG: hypothetical protein LBD19_01725 [Endomicrobium sp.]|jgi:hypothetical protein|nr:hypothetical protein [Endomicrobium sp.]
MKKIATVLMLLLGVIYADNIAGFEFGEVFKDYKKYKEFNGKKILPHEFVINDVKFFDEAEIGTDKNYVIKSIVFIKKYTVNMRNSEVKSKEITRDYNDMLTTLEKRYGKFDKSKTKFLKRQDSISESFFPLAILDSVIDEVSIKENPKSNKIKRIWFCVKSDNKEIDIFTDDSREITMVLMYVDKDVAYKFDMAKIQRTEGF